MKVIKETQKDLRVPKGVDPSIRSDDIEGLYPPWGSDTIRLNEKYLKELTDQQAAELLDTLMHETLHANDPLWKRIWDATIDRDHPDVYRGSDRRTKDILEKYLKERRKPNPCAR